MFVSKPQTQKKLTAEIMEEIKNRLDPTGIGIVIKAIHTCVFGRGVQSNKAEFTTNAMYGKILKSEASFFHAYENIYLLKLGSNVLMILSNLFGDHKVF